jgi:hypothetical protein
VTIPTANNEQATQTETSTDLGNMSFAEYEKARRGEASQDGGQKSAPAAKAAEHKESEDSDPSETEADESDQDDAEAKGSDEDQDAKDTDEEKPAKKKSGIQRRVDKLNKRVSAAQQEAEYWKQRALEGANGSKPEPKVDAAAKASDTAGKPSPDAYETHAEYVEALADWKIDQRDKAREAKQRQDQAMTEQQKVQAAHSERVKSFVEKTEDFQDVIESVDDIRVSPAVGKAIEEAILSSENGPALMYELAKNRDEYARIVGLTPIAAVRELGKIESRLSASEEKIPETKKITNAPKPVAPVGKGKSVAQAKSLNDPNISFAEYEKIRREQLKRRGAQ